MSIVKIALEQNQQSPGGIAGFTKRHPYLTAGIALTGGIAAADTLTRAGAKMLENHQTIRPLMEGVKHKAIEGAREGLAYGAVLGAVEPAILHGVFKKRSEVEK